MIVPKVQKQPKANKISASKATPATVKTMHGIGVSHDAIRERAFQIYESRGSKHGHDIRDWLRAEQQVLAP